MSIDPQSPENPANRDPSDFAKDYVGFDDNDLWNLDETSDHAVDPLPDADKSYGVMEQIASPEFSEKSAIQPSAGSPTSSKSLSITEKACLFAIVAALITSATLAIIHFSKEIPVDSSISKKVSLPVEGKLTQVTAAETYWRAPITQGDNPDIVRRGVILIPVLKIQASGKSSAIRIFFRDSDGTLVGDSSTHAISGNQTLTISATDGFTDMSMHASYRTGENARWMIEAFEGPAIDAPIEQFHPLFETEISTDIR